MVRTIALKLSAAALLLPLFYGASLAADLVVGMPNWPSGQASANIIKYGIEKKFGLKVDVQEMGTLIDFRRARYRRSGCASRGLAA